MTTPSDNEIVLFIMRQFIDSPQLWPALPEREEHVGTICGRYRHSNWSVPSEGRVERVFKALGRAGFLVSSWDCPASRNRFWNLSPTILKACEANVVRSADDLFTGDIKRRVMLKLYGVWGAQ